MIKSFLWVPGSGAPFFVIYAQKVPDSRLLSGTLPFAELMPRLFYLKLFSQANSVGEGSFISDCLKKVAA